MNATVAAVVQDGEDMQPIKVWDPEKLGRIIDGARIRAGYSRIADLVVDMERKTGVRRHENTLYDVKNGKRLPDLELMTALMLTLKISHMEVSEAVTEDFRQQYVNLFRR
jgi:hypothetical protein